MTCVLALDQGTTSSRAIVFDAAGRPLAIAQREFAQHFPQPGWVEHDPLEIWRTQRDTAREAIAKAGVAAVDIAAIAMTNQRETVVLWDRKTGAPLANAIVWQDRRTTDTCERLSREAHGAMVAARTGLVLDPYFSATKIAWLLDHVPGARARAERGELAAGTIDTWLIWQLTGGRAHLTDPSNASRTSLFDIHSGEWEEALLSVFDVPRALLAKVVPSSAVVAETSPELFGRPIPIAGIAGDQQAALFGQGCHARGMAKNTYGTGCFMLAHAGGAPIGQGPGLLQTRAAELEGGGPQYALEGSVFIGGAVVQWLRDGLGIIQSAAEVEALARSVPDAGGVILVPAFTGLGAPHWDPRARGTIVGLTRGSSKAHIARAALESIAWQSADLAIAMQGSDALTLTELRVDGGAAANDTLMQIQADTLGLPVVRPKVLETTALGAAYLAGLARGVWSSLDEIAAQWQRDRVFDPQWSDDQRETRRAQWLRAVERAKGWSA